jgi:hypothetical protein
MTNNAKRCPKCGGQVTPFDFDMYRCENRPCLKEFQESEFNSLPEWEPEVGNLPCGPFHASCNCDE